MHPQRIRTGMPATSLGGSGWIKPWSGPEPAGKPFALNDSAVDIVMRQPLCRQRWRRYGDGAVLMEMAQIMRRLPSRL